MVLKNLVRYIINKYLKDYIEQLDYEKLKLDLKMGHVCLEKLHLKPEALTDLSLPVTVSTGYLEKLTLIIPWKNLYNNPTKVYIDGLYMLIVPKNEVRRDLTEYYEEKMRRVQGKVENLRRAILNNKKVDEKERTFLERMRLQIMQNLQIDLRNLHISYETISTTKLGHPFSFGLTISHLEMSTTSNNRTSGRTKDKSTVIFKMKEIHALSLYWNTQCQSRINMSFDDVVADLKSKIATDTYLPKSDEMNYILYPIDLLIDLTIVFQPGEYNFERPVYDLAIQLEQLNLNIDPKQFSDLLDFIKFQNYSKLYDRCREYRQLQLQQAFALNELTLDQKERLQYLEAKLDVFNLAYIRHSVEMESTLSEDSAHYHLMKKKRLVNSQESMNSHHRWWNSWWKNKTHSREDRRRSSVSTSAEFSTEDSPNIDVKVQVNHLTLNLTFSEKIHQSHASKSTEDEILCPIKISNASIDFKRRAVSSNILFRIDLQSLSLFGMQTVDHSRPALVTQASKSSRALIHSELELSPMDHKSAYRLNFVMEPIQIAYDAPTINEIIRGFDPNNDQRWAILPEIKQRTMEEMEQDLCREKIFDMTLELKGISLLLPENGVLFKCSPIIQIDFDHLMLKSTLDDRTFPSKEQSQQSRVYTKYNLKMHNLRMIYSQSDQSQKYLLRQIPLIDMNFYKCIYSTDANLTDWRIDTTIARMGEIELSRSILTQVMSHLKSVPLLYSNMMEALHRINLYFMIFPPHTTAEVNLSLLRCSLLLTPISIITDISSHISKTRDGKKIRISLTNFIMSHQITSRLFYQNDSIDLKYDTDLHIQYDNADS